MNVDNAVVAIAAILAPTITATITARYKLRELKQQSDNNFSQEDKLHRREIFENYLKYANAIEVSGDKYQEAYLLALVIAPPEAQKLMKKYDAGYVQKSPIIERYLLVGITEIIEKEFNSLL